MRGGKQTVVLTVISLLACLAIFYLKMQPEKPEWDNHHQNDNVETMGTRDTSQVKKAHPYHLTIEQLAAMDYNDLAETYHGYVNSMQTHCAKRVRVGNPVDGGWDVCFDDPYTLQAPCLVYSFGINNDWSFDDAMALQYHCEVFAYDPSMTNTEEHVRKGKIHFRKTGLNGSNEDSPDGWRMRTFGAILEENGHINAIIDSLKIDIETSEYFAFPQMLQSGSFRNVKQLCFEIHMNRKTMTTEHYLRSFRILLDLYNEGFRIFFSNRNAGTVFKPKSLTPWYTLTRAGCHELCMVKHPALLKT